MNPHPTRRRAALLASALAAAFACSAETGEADRSYTCDATGAMDPFCIEYGPLTEDRAALVSCPGAMRMDTRCPTAGRVATCFVPAAPGPLGSRSATEISHYLSTFPPSSDGAACAQAGGTWTQRGGQVFAEAGLSTIGGDPAAEALHPNPALVDGEVFESTGLDVGFGRTAAGDVALRQAGARLPDAAGGVNRIDVSVTIHFGTAVEQAFGWTVWASADGVGWAEVPVRRVVPNSPALTFHLLIDATRARHLKVATAPLAVGVVTAESHASFSVSELRFFADDPS